MSDHSDDQAGPAPDEHHTPRWVKVSGVIALVLVVLLIAVLLFGGGPGGHGPGRHSGSDGTDHRGDHTAQEGGTHNRAFDDAGDVACRCGLPDDGMAAPIQVPETHDPTPDGRHR